jgi:hypothetical protein
MERWAANTLRTLAIVFFAGLVLISSFLLLLFSLCAWQGGFSGNKHPEQALAYLVAAVLVMVIGSSVSGWLSRGIIRSSAADLAAFPAPSIPPSISSSAQPATASAASVSVRLHFSPLGRKTIDHLVLALVAQTVLSALAWFFNQLHFWTAPRGFAPHNWTLILLAPFILYHVPYAILIYYLLKKPDRRTFAYALAVPAVLVLQALVSLSLVTFTYIHEPWGFLLLFLPWLIHIVILVFAYKAVQQTGIHPEPSSLMTAALMTFLYFSFIHVITPFLYRFTSWR